jgi:hypothetical protein
VISFESNSRLKRLESHVFGSLAGPITIPSTILFIAHDATPGAFSTLLSDGDSCPEFDRWRRLWESRIAVDFRRIVRTTTVPPLAFSADCGRFDVSEFTQSEIERGLQDLANLRHLLISEVIGFVLEKGELKIGRLPGVGNSLAEFLSEKPEWWTPTAKVKAVVGIALPFRFAHGLGLFHGSLTVENVFFDCEKRIQIVDFNPIPRGGPFSDGGEKIRADLFAFSILAFEILVGRPCPRPLTSKWDLKFPPEADRRVFKMMEEAVWGTASFIDIFGILRNQFFMPSGDFQIVDGVDSAEVCAFVNWVESAEEPAEWEM